MTKTTRTTEPQEGLRRHKLLPVDIRKALPDIGQTESVELDEKVIQVKYFTPFGNWTWYAIEFDGDDVFFGYVEGFECEWGYFSFSELANAEAFGGVPAVERDCFFEPIKFADLPKREPTY